MVMSIMRISLVLGISEIMVVLILIIVITKALMMTDIKLIVMFYVSTLSSPSEGQRALACRRHAWSSVGKLRHGSKRGVRAPLRHCLRNCRKTC